ncbi:MAG TPA: bifunctional diguanylate cyclase/phosphodiesterase [Mycobacterium sp.]
MKLRIADSKEVRAGLSTRALLLVAATYFCVIGFVGLWLWQSWAGEFVTRAVDDFASLTGVLFAAGCAGWAALAAQGRTRRGWLAMMAGLLAWAVGELTWGYYEVWLGYEQAPFPSWADAGYLLFPVGAGAAVLLLSETDRGQSRKRLLLDGVVVATSVFLVSWVTVLDNVFRAGGETRLAFAVSLAYPLADIAIITIAWARAAAAYRHSLGLLIAGLIIIAVCDSVFAGMTAVNSYYTGNMIDLGWLAGCGVLGLAALRSIGEQPVEPTMTLISSHARLWLPYLPLVLACGVGLAKALPVLGSVGLAGAGALLVIAVLVRQFIVLAENRKLLSDVARLAFRDQLTGLPNRALFLDRLEHALARRRREEQPLAVLCLDLDNFKTVNDELGHPAGDELLVRVAGRLTECLRSTDTVARLGGDEFVFLIEGSAEDSIVAAERILATFSAPIVVEGVALTVAPSIGLTLATPETASATVDDLLRQADLAMYAAKRDGGGCLRSFVPDSPNPYELPQVSNVAIDRPAMTVIDPMPPAAVSASGRSPEIVAQQSRWPPTAIRYALGALFVAVCLYTILELIGSHSAHAVPLSSWSECGLLLSAAGIVAIRAWRVGVERSAWIFIAAGMTATAAGVVVSAVWGRHDGHSLSAADLPFLAFYPLVYAGLLILVYRRLRRVPATLLLDSFIVGSAAAAVAAALEPGVAAAATSGALATVTVIGGMAYGIGGLLVFALVIGSWSILGWRAEWRWGVIFAAVALWVVAEISYLFRIAHGASGGAAWIDICWPAAFLLIAAASWIPSTAGAARPRHSSASLAVPVVCTVVALGVSVLAYGDRVAVTLAAVSLTVVAARYAVTFRDVSALAESHELAMTDELTGLPNRRALMSALTAGPSDRPASTPWDRTGGRMGLLLLDVDQFREINDSLGRNVGDELLCRIAYRLSQASRPTDLLARSGGDEFGILLTDCHNRTTARAQAGVLIDALREPFALDHITVQVDVGVAISLWPDHCVRPEELLTRAEAALADAKTTVGGIAVYDASVDVLTNNDTVLAEDLRTALSDAASGPSAHNRAVANAGDLTCYYQPKINAHDEQVHSVEALVRWNHPVHGLLLPDQFLPAAERAGLMRPVSTRVLDIALAQAHRWHAAGIPLTVAVNLSTTNLLDLGLVDTIEELLKTYKVPAEALILEITESTLTTDSQRSRNTVAALRQLGIRLSLDDYGTGWSSLARLQDLSVDELKLDQIFVARLARDPRSIAIVRSTVALAHSLGAELVAEGVEDEATLHALRLYGCTVTQGHVHSPPLPADELEQWLLNWPRDLTSPPWEQAGVSD